MLSVNIKLTFGVINFIYIIVNPQLTGKVSLYTSFTQHY